MNERIKQLAEQARAQYCDLSDASCFKRLGLVEAVVFKPEDLKKFAELIVRECLKEIKDMIVDESERLYPNNKQTTECVNDRLLDAYDNIKEHFGVEE